jgi:hypothetical protein
MLTRTPQGGIGKREEFSELVTRSEGNGIKAKVAQAA